MINARAITIDNVTLVFTEFISMVINYRFLKQWFYHNYCLQCALLMLSGRGPFPNEKNKDLPTINHKSVESKSFCGVTYPKKFGERYGSYTSQHRFEKIRKKRSPLANLCKVQAGYCVYVSMFVMEKWNIDTWDVGYILPISHIFPYNSLL